MSEINFELHEKQGIAFQSEATEILYGGAAGGGKSHLMRVASIIWCKMIPGFQVYLFRRQYPDLIKNHIDGPTGYPALIDPLVKTREAKMNWGKNSVEFRNGSIIHLCHLQHKKNIYNYQGAEIHFLIMDELTHFLKEEYTYLRGRLRLGGLKFPEELQHLKKIFPRILCGSNPGGKGHTWVKHTFVDFAKPLEIKRVDKSDGGMLRQYIPALLYDNPTLMENDPDYGDRLSGLGNKALVKAMKEGDWNIVSGGAVDDVWEESTHVIKPFKIPKTWYIDRSLDWGSSKPSSVGYWAESDGCTVTLSDGSQHTFPKGTLFRIHEYYSWNGNANEGLKLSAEEVAKEVKKIDDMFANLGYKVNPGPADNQIYNSLHLKDENKAVSIASEMEKAGVSWEHSYKVPGSRKQGLEILRLRLKEALKPNPEEPCLYIFENCRHFIRTVPVLPRDENDPDDVDSEAEDHVYDETRYRLLNKNSEVSIQSTDHY